LAALKRVTKRRKKMMQEIPEDQEGNKFRSKEPQKIVKKHAQPCGCTRTGEYSKKRAEERGFEFHFFAIRRMFNIAVTAMLNPVATIREYAPVYFGRTQMQTSITVAPAT